MNDIENKRFENIDKHIAVLNSEMGGVQEDVGEIKVDLAVVKTDVNWLKRFFFIVATASIGSLLATLFSILG